MPHPAADLASVDVFSPDAYESGIPHASFALLRDAAPVHRHPDPQLPEGFWAVTRHADVVAVSRNPELFSSYERLSTLGEADGELLDTQRLMMLNMDPPEHSRLRALVNRGFTPRTTLTLESKVEAACERIVDAAVAQGEGDFVTLCSAELPLVVIADLMGVPQEHRHRLFHWSNRLVGGDDVDLGGGTEDGQAAQMEMFQYADELGARKRACPVDDIVSKLVRPDRDGNELTALEFDLFFMLLAVAGNETTRNAISGGMLALVRHPEQWERLKADPEGLAGTAADEIVRWVSPVNAFRRTAMRDTELGGQKIAAGDKVVVYYSSANHDESVFADPYTFDIGRDPNPMLGFGGGGPHFCLGRHLAKLELEIMFRTLARKIDRVEPTGPARRMRSNFLNGIKDMPVRIIPA
ncbi:cytochrome P450 [Yinghuangia seranimata]|uniref:cytochrome P450 n=1 Tax=Yinghuangia seranimata TaxID=408067 RepID=UPI00248BE301|nr:cytochrome P450 [Yinghuangia seranimata]MDI2124672.1 cytochrome P450 [Yinghuangia seranimata]